MPRQYKLARKMKKIALTAAAKEMGISQSTLSGWESERTVPSIEGLERMADYYRVSTDFLLGRDTQADPRPDWLQPLDPKALPAFHETPVYVWDKGWAFVDAVERLLRFADGETLPFSDVQSVSFLPPSYALPMTPSTVPLLKGKLSQYEEIWVEPISSDAVLRGELRGWYRVKGRYVENEVGQRFYLDFYEAKWLAFPKEEEEP